MNLLERLDALATQPWGRSFSPTHPAVLKRRCRRLLGQLDGLADRWRAALGPRLRALADQGARVVASLRIDEPTAKALAYDLGRLAADLFHAGKLSLGRGRR